MWKPLACAIAAIMLATIAWALTHWLVVTVVGREMLGDNVVHFIAAAVSASVFVVVCCLGAVPEDGDVS